MRLPTSSWSARPRWTKCCKRVRAHPGQPAARRRHRSSWSISAAASSRRRCSSTSTNVDGAARASGPTRTRSRSAPRSRSPSSPRIPQVVEHYPVLAQAAAHIAGPTHRNMGTVGGNLCLDTRCLFYNQSEWWRSANNHCLKTTGEICHVAPKSRGVCFATFSGDLAPALADARRRESISTGPQGARTMPLRTSISAMPGRISRSPRRRATANIICRCARARSIAAVRAREHARPALGL